MQVPTCTFDLVLWMFHRNSVSETRLTARLQEFEIAQQKRVAGLLDSNLVSLTLILSCLLQDDHMI